MRSPVYNQVVDATPASDRLSCAFLRSQIKPDEESAKMPAVRTLDLEH